jgi:surface antigen
MGGRVQVSTKSRIIIASALCVPLVLSGCKTVETAFDNDCKVGGAAIGAVLGGVAGGLLFGKAAGKAGTALLGAAVGGLIGQQIGSLLDCQDKQALATASQTAGDAPVGQKVVWASDSAKVAAPAEPAAAEAPPAPAAKTASAPAQPPKPKAQPQRQVKTAPLPPPAPSGPAPSQGGPWQAVEPAPSSGTQRAAAEPIRSGGQSGNWGWVEPVSAPAKTADGRTCRTLKQVVVDSSGAQHEELVTSCLNDQKQWVIASR